MNVKIKVIILLLVGVVLSGCSSAKYNRQAITQWIPLGTSQEDAITTMKQHGFESGPCGADWRRPKGEKVLYFSHENKVLKRTHYFFVRFKDDKAVSIIGPKTNNHFFDFLEYDDKL